MGQNGTFAPNSCDMARANAVFPVPGAPTSNKARPENFRDFMRSTTTPQACSQKKSFSKKVGGKCVGAPREHWFDQ